MAGFYVEQRVVSNASSITWDIARHLFTRQLRGVAVVLSSKPAGFHSALTKQWYKLVRMAEREQASTLNANRIQEFTREVAQMQRLRFVVGPPTEGDDYAVFLARPADTEKVPANCHTLYVTPDISVSLREGIMKYMPPHSLVVVYE